MAATPLEVRVFDGVRRAAELASVPEVARAKVYRRPTITVDPQRDTLPCVVVAPTPGANVGRSKTLSKLTWTYPVTAVLVTSHGWTSALGESWRSGWAERVMRELDDNPLDGVPECTDIRPDSLTLIDLTAFDSAGLWVSRVSVVVTCRIPLTRCQR